MRYDFDKGIMVENSQEPLAIRIRIDLQTADGEMNEIVNLGFLFDPYYHKTHRLAEGLMLVAENHIRALIEGYHEALTNIRLKHTHDYENIGRDTLTPKDKFIYQCKGCPSVRIL